VAAAPGALDAAYRFHFEAGPLVSQSAGQRILMRCDNDLNLGSISTLFAFDRAVLRITAIEVANISQPGAWFPPRPQGEVDLANTRGQVVHFEVFGLNPGSDPPFDITRVLPPGAGHDVLRLTVEVLAAAPAGTTLRFLNQNPFFNDDQTNIRWNVMTLLDGASQGVSVQPPALALVDRDIAIVECLERPPVAPTRLAAAVSAAGVTLSWDDNAPGESAYVVERRGPGEPTFQTIALLPADSETYLDASAPVPGSYEYQVRSAHGPQVRAACRFSGPAGPVTVTLEFFRRGDANGDGFYDISDILGVLTALFVQGPSLGCFDAADLNDDGSVDLSDAVFGLNFIYRDGLRPRPPGHVACGQDPTPDGLPPCAYPSAACR
jgi:hypothetical protein